MDYLKTVIPSQLLAERGSNLVVINPGSANIRVGLAQQDAPFSIPHCIAWRTAGANDTPKRNVQDQMLNSQETTAQHREREKTYDIIASLLKISSINEEVSNSLLPKKMGRADGSANPQKNKREKPFQWTNVFEKKPNPTSAEDSLLTKSKMSEPQVPGEGDAKKELGSSLRIETEISEPQGPGESDAKKELGSSLQVPGESDAKKELGSSLQVPGESDAKKELGSSLLTETEISEPQGPGESDAKKEPASSFFTETEISEPQGPGESDTKKEPGSSEWNLRDRIFGEEALRISPTEPYCLRRPIRRGHFNISQHYSMQQVLEDIQAIWDWILIEKLHIPRSERHMFSVILVVPESFDNREIKEILTIIFRDLHFTSAVVHQEGIAAIFGSGLSTACVVNLGAQMTTVICIEDGAALPATQMTLRFGGEDISRCLLWSQRHHQTWPLIRTDALAKPVDLLMLNRLKETYCQIKEGKVEEVAVVHSYEDGIPAGSHTTKLTALNVPPMGLFFPTLLVPDVYPPPPRSWFNDYEDMLEDNWNMDFQRRPDMADGYYPVNSGYPMWDSYPSFQSKLKKEDNIGIAEAITKSILSTGRIELQRKLFCSIQLVGGVALTNGLVAAMEERVLHTIPSHEAIDTVEVVEARTNQMFIPWKGGAIIGVLDYGREAWIHREDWVRSGIHLGTGRKYKDSYYLQAQATCYVNS